eukprot:CAMPEP_0178446126 /NCGR_PEP_ID=MMETSP0689_2-20121128/40610_1 /TAXON_ID=160604 /ORGANISM="Amphidinium massartii, Strain CS-259" /LENGTH=280 /DNA_ID=CAMNT_0020070875 /DNA_START=164 /DNA_END=1006 /DNA_ORIENTATION=+
MTLRLFVLGLIVSCGAQSVSMPLEEVAEGSCLIQGKSSVATSAGASDFSLPDELASLTDEFAEAAELKHVYTAQARAATDATQPAGEPQSRQNFYRTVVVDLAIVAFTVYLFSRRNEKASGDSSEVSGAIKVSKKDSCGKVIVANKTIATEDVWGCTPLHGAAGRGAVSEVGQLLEAGADVDATEAWDETPLHFAARAGHPEVCKELLLAGARVDAVNASDETPLVVAARAGKEDACRLLLTSGATTAGIPDSELPPLLSALLFERMFSQIGSTEAPTVA